jgi:hypothetical protein
MITSIQEFREARFLEPENSAQKQPHHGDLPAGRQVYTHVSQKSIQQIKSPFDDL